MIKVNLGCGSKKLDGWVNCDIDKSVKPDLVFDLNKKFPFRNDDVDEILLDNVLEHTGVKIMREVYRVLKRNGTCKIVMPNFFRWKSRFNFLFHGRLEDSDGWELNHSIFINYSDFRAILRNMGFAVPKKNLFERLFEPEINIVIRKREDLGG